MKTRQRRKYSLLAGIAAATLTLTSCAGDGTEASGTEETYTVSFASAVGVDHPSSIAFQEWSAGITEATDGAVQFEAHYDGSLCDMGDIAACISDGTVDMGMVMTAYEPANFPVANIASIGFLTNDLQALATAFEELYTTSDDIQTEFGNQNLHLSYTMAADPYVIATKDEITDFEGLNGTSLRASGDAVESLDALGINPVSMSVAESYEAIDRDVIDGINTGLAALVAARLHEVAPNIYDIGQYWGNGMLMLGVMNSNTWEQFAPEVQEVINNHNADVTQGYIENYVSMEAECAALEETGAKVHSIGPSQAGEAWAADASQADAQAWIDVAQTVMSDPEALLDEYVDLIASHEQTTEQGTPASNCQQP